MRLDRTVRLLSLVHLLGRSNSAMESHMRGAPFGTCAKLGGNLTSQSNPDLCISTFSSAATIASASGTRLQNRILEGSGLRVIFRSPPLFFSNASHRDHFAAETAALHRVGPPPLCQRLRFKRGGRRHQRRQGCLIYLPQLSKRSLGRVTMKLPRPAILLLLLLVSVALLPLFASSRTLPPKQQPTGGEIPPVTGKNTTAPPRHPRHGGNRTVAAGNRTKGGHPNKGHHRVNGTAAGGPKRANGTAAGGPKRGNGTAAGGPKRGNGIVAGGPKRGNGTAAGGPSPKLPANGNAKNGNAPNGQKNGGAQPNKNGGGGGGAQTNKNGGAQTNKNGGGGGSGGANKPRRPKQIAEENCSSKTSWPEVVGMTGEKARNYILTSMPECNWDVRIIPSRGFATMDYRTNRVRIFVDKEGIVRVPPRIG
ncbi:unnamed protein product [Closterium sp. Yama58-4]|nr:unnamed protein product [Closterium sp. Yama58-4]